MLWANRSVRYWSETMPPDMQSSMSRHGSLARRFWRWFTTPPSLAELMRRAAVGLWLTPIVMAFPLVVLPALEPSSIPGMLAEYWQVYLLVFGLPFALGAILWRLSRGA